jgi:predicted transcriptional regulator YheO
MDNQILFKRYIQLADVLGQMFQNVLEVVIHDFKDLDHAIIHIVNGHISGRAIGGPASELNIRRLLEHDQLPDMLISYTSRNSRGQQLKSSSLAIRDDQGKLIGAFCLHFDLSQFEQFQKFLEYFVSSKVHSLVGLNDFGASQPHDEEIKSEIDKWLLSENLYATQLTYKDKQSIVGYLYRRGCFKKKGAISIIANALQLTRQCIYNYLELAKSHQEEPSGQNGV